MSRTTLPITEIVVSADCWQDARAYEAIITRAITAAAEAADADTDGVEVAVMLTDDAGIPR